MKIIKLQPSQLCLEKFQTPAWNASITLREPEIVLKLPLLLQKVGIAMLPNPDDLRVAGLLQLGGQPSFRDDPMESI